VAVGGTDGVAVAEEICPSMGAIADARLMMPITTRITGQVWPNEKPLRVCSRRNNIPTVMITAGPIKLRMVQRRQLQRMRSLICVGLQQLFRHQFSLAFFCATRSRASQPVAEHQNTDTNENEGPKTLYSVKRKPREIVQEKQDADANQNYGTDRSLFAPGF
jgi:hypothetical protein